MLHVGFERVSAHGREEAGGLQAHDRGSGE